MQADPVTFFAQKLAANSKQVRDKAVRRLKKWIVSRQSSNATEFSGDNMLKLWKGLFYCMWMSDKPEIQEELARTISEIIYHFGNTNSSLLFIKGFFETVDREWANLDYLRIDKYMMFVRVFLNQSFEFVHKLKWDVEATNQLIGILEDTVINPKSEDASMGLRIHVADIYVEELAKVAGSELTGKQLTMFFLPYCRLLAENKKWSVIHHVFEFTLRLCDDPESEDEAQIEESTSMTKEGETLLDVNKNGDGDGDEDEDMEAYESGSDEEDEEDDLHKLYGEYKGEDKFLRKIRRHEMESMKLPFPNFNYKDIGDTLLEMVGASPVKIKQKLRNQTYRLVKKFHEMASGVFPLDGVNPSIGRRLRTRDYDAAALLLLRLDDEISKEKRLWRTEAWDDRKRKQEKTTDNSEDSGLEDEADSSNENDAEVSPHENDEASPKPVALKDKTHLEENLTNGKLHLGKSKTVKEGPLDKALNQKAKKNRKRRRPEKEISNSTTIDVKKAKLVMSPTKDDSLAQNQKANAFEISKVTYADRKAKKAAVKKQKRKLRVMRYKIAKLARMVEKEAKMTDTPSNTPAVTETPLSPNMEETTGGNALANITDKAKMRKRKNIMNREKVEERQSPSSESVIEDNVTTNEVLEESSAEKMEVPEPTKSPCCTETPQKSPLASSTDGKRNSDSRSVPKHKRQHLLIEDMPVQKDVKTEDNRGQKIVDSFTTTEVVEESSAEKMEVPEPTKSPSCTETPQKSPLASSTEGKRNSDSRLVANHKRQHLLIEDMPIQPEMKAELIVPSPNTEIVKEDDSSVPAGKSSPVSPRKSPVVKLASPDLPQSDASPVLKRKVQLVTLWTPPEKKSPSSNETPGPRRSARNAKKTPIKQAVSVGRAANKRRYYDEVADRDFDHSEDLVKSSKCDTPVATKSTTPKVSPMVQFEDFVKTPPAFFRLAVKKVTPQKAPATAKKTPAKEKEAKSTKKVNFSLTKNSSQGIKHYAMSLRSRPGIPFNADKVPAQGVLKPSPRS